MYNIFTHSYSSNSYVLILAVLIPLLLVGLLTTRAVHAETALGYVTPQSTVFSATNNGNEAQIQILTKLLNQLIALYNQLIAAQNQKTGSSTNLMVVSPNGGESLEVGEAYTIRWRAHGILHFKITYENVDTHGKSTIVDDLSSSDSVTSMSHGDDSSMENHEYRWNVPATLKVGNYRIGISNSDAVGSSTIDTSDTNFVIDSYSKGSITVTTPRSATILNQGTATDISWESVSPKATYILSYSQERSDKKTTIGTYAASEAHCSTAGKCYVSWTPNFSSTSISLSVAAEGYSGQTTIFGSSGLFDIEPPKETSSVATTSITVSAPENSVWQSGTNQTIKWSDDNAADGVYYTVRITHKNLTSYGIIADSVRNKSFRWNVGTLADGTKLPALASGESAYYVQIERTTAPKANAFAASSTASFTITNAVQ